MKKRLALLVLLLVPLAIWAADPAFDTYAKATGAVTIDSVFDGTYWEVVDNIIYTTTDAACVVFTIKGVALMDPGDKLWLGIGNDSLPLVSGAFATRAIDSMLIKHSLTERDKAYIPFEFTAILDTTAATDTIFFSAACGGHGDADPVELTNVFVTVEIGDDMP